MANDIYLDSIELSTATQIAICIAVSITAGGLLIAGLWVLNVLFQYLFQTSF